MSPLAVNSLMLTVAFGAVMLALVRKRYESKDCMYCGGKSGNHTREDCPFGGYE